MVQSDPLLKRCCQGHCLRHEGGKVRHCDGPSSSRYLVHIIRHAAKQLFDNMGEVTCRALRRKDFQEITLEKNEEVLLHFAAFKTSRMWF